MRFLHCIVLCIVFFFVYGIVLCVPQTADIHSAFGANLLRGLFVLHRGGRDNPAPGNAARCLKTVFPPRETCCGAGKSVLK